LSAAWCFLLSSSELSSAVVAVAGVAQRALMKVFNPLLCNKYNIRFDVGTVYQVKYVIKKLDCRSNRDEACLTPDPCFSHFNYFSLFFQTISTYMLSTSLVLIKGASGIDLT
jgi:hypothetical protein